MMHRRTFATIVGTGALALTATLSGYGVATAADGPNGHAGSGNGPAAVPGTFAGMPPTAQVLWAVVNADATLARGFGATGTTNLGAGFYEVRFRQNVTGCTYHATIGQSGAGVAPHGHITTAARAGVPNGVFLATADVNGNTAARQFHLLVSC